MPRCLKNITYISFRLILICILPSLYKLDSGNKFQAYSNPIRQFSSIATVKFRDYTLSSEVRASLMQIFQLHRYYYTRWNLRSVNFGLVCGQGLASRLWLLYLLLLWEFICAISGIGVYPAFGVTVHKRLKTTF
jgi:hypothetical protein